MPLEDRLDGASAQPEHLTLAFRDQRFGIERKPRFACVFSNDKRDGQGPFPRKFFSCVNALNVVT
jgi:hypothetical protein